MPSSIYASGAYLCAVAAAHVDFLLLMLRFAAAASLRGSRAPGVHIGDVPYRRLLTAGRARHMAQSLRGATSQ